MISLTPPKGTRDFYPEEMTLQKYLFTSWEKTCRRYGFEQYDGPMFEHLELYTHKSGNEIEKQLYSFEDKSGRKLALRPEMTPSLARMVTLKGSSLKTPIRWYSIPRLFRYEKMQKGRLREFYQLNIDILGVAHGNADAEIIALSIDVLRDLGLTKKDFSVHISSRTLLEDLFLGVGVKNETLPELYSILDKRAKLSAEDFEHLLFGCLQQYDLQKKVLNILNVPDLESLRSIPGSGSALSEMESIIKTMHHYGMEDFIQFDISIVRGLAYYTGTVFEIHDRGGNFRAIAGGGRYDRLVTLYGGEQTHAVGLAIGDVVISEILQEKGLLPKAESRAQVFIVILQPSSYSKAIILTQQIRASGISCEYALKPQSIGKQMKTANAAGAHLTIFIGGEEEADGKVKIRNMKTGDEQLINESKSLACISSMLKAESLS